MAQFENTFRQIDQRLWKDPGCSSELDYLEQKSWLLFLKYIEDFENEKEDEAQLTGKNYKRLITGFYRWSAWAAPKKTDGGLDVINAMTGDDLVEFVNRKLFPELRKFKDTAPHFNTLEYKIGEIFDELHNKIQSGFILREVINLVDQLRFQSSDDKHEMTALYENNIQKMGNAGRNGGEYYTPRPLIRTIVRAVNPTIGERVYDGACGSSGFLCEAFVYMKAQIKTTAHNKLLQESTFYGKEKKVLPYIISIMNMIFHGVTSPNIIHGNTLAENLDDIDENRKMDVILANPPFGGNERAEIQQNFEIQTSETAYMFMQHFVKMLKGGGRAGIVIKNTFLSNGDARLIRKMLLDECNLHTILDLPGGVFTGAGVKTVVLFFTKGVKTEKVWYYQVDRHFTKTNPMTEDDLAEFLDMMKTRQVSGHSWTVCVSDLDDNLDLSVKNPNKSESVDQRSPREIALNISELNQKVGTLINEILEVLE